MKKNIFSVIITAVMFFVMLPAFQKTNNLLGQVGSVLNLELDADAEADDAANYTIKDLEPYPVAFTEQATYNLKSENGEEGQHYALLKGYSLNLNTKADDFDDVKKIIETNSSQITGALTTVIQEHTLSEATPETIKKEAVEAINKLLDSKAVVSIDLDGYVTQ